MENKTKPNSDTVKRLPFSVDSLLSTKTKSSTIAKNTCTNHNNNNESGSMDLRQSVKADAISPQRHFQLFNGASLTTKLSLDGSTKPHGLNLKHNSDEESIPSKDNGRAHSMFSRLKLPPNTLLSHHHVFPSHGKLGQNKQEDGNKHSHQHLQLQLQERFLAQQQQHRHHSHSLSPHASSTVHHRPGSNSSNIGSQSLSISLPPIPLQPTSPIDVRQPSTLVASPHETQKDKEPHFSGIIFEEHKPDNETLSQTLPKNADDITATTTKKSEGEFISVCENIDSFRKLFFASCKFSKTKF